MPIDGADFRESYKFNRAVEELRIVSTSIVELKEILIALTIAVYIVALCYAISLCLKITRRTRRVAKADVESHCITPVRIRLGGNGKAILCLIFFYFSPSPKATFRGALLGKNSKRCAMELLSMEQYLTAISTRYLLQIDPHP